MRDEISWNSLEEYFEKMRAIFEEVYRVVKKGRVVAVNVNDYIYNGERLDLIFQWHCLLKEVGFKYRDIIIWRKTGKLTTVGAGKMASNFIKYRLPMYWDPNREMEAILIFTKGNKEIPKYSGKIKELSKVDLNEVRDYLENVWDIAPRQDKVHKAVFPYKIPELVIKFYSYVGEIVLDPFVGTGTTMVVAKKLLRSCIGCEINPKYWDYIKSNVGWGERSVTDDVVYEYKEVDV